MVGKFKELVAFATRRPVHEWPFVGLVIQLTAKTPQPVVISQ